MGIGHTEISATQEHFGFLRPEPIEKDWYVVQAIRAIQGLDASPFRLVFAGGTCLARAHRLVDRMSEDVDFKVIAEPQAPTSKSGRKAALSALKQKVCEALQAEGFAIDPATDIQAQDGNTYILFQLDYTDKQDQVAVLRPKIQVELNFTILRTAPETKPVQSLIAQAHGTPAEILSIACTSLTETAAEKFVSLTRRTAMLLAGVARDPDPSLIRHLYDLHQLRPHIDMTRFKDLVDEIQLQDSDQFGHQHPAYRDNPTAETARAITYLATDVQPRDDYEKFMTVMVYGTPVDYTQAVEILIALANHGRGDHIVQANGAASA